jgi:hypothetical protein
LTSTRSLAERVFSRIERAKNMSAPLSDYKSLLNQYATRLWYLEGNVIYLSPPESTVSGGASKSAGKGAAPELRDIREFFDSDLMAPRTPYYTKELVELARGRTDDVGDLFKRVGGKNGEIDPYTLALWLRRIEGRHVDGKRLHKDTSDRARPRWVLDQVSA